MHAGRQHRRRRGFRGVRLEPHPQLSHQPLGIRQNVHQMTDRRPLIAADIPDAVFQQRLRQRQNALARESFARAKTKLLDLGRK